MNKLTSEQLSDVMIQGVAGSVFTLDRFETMAENGLLATRAKQAVKNCIPHLTNYVNKVFANFDVEDERHILKSATYVSELVNRMETAVSVKNLLTISDRKDILKEILEKNLINESVYHQIVDSEILNY